MFDKKAILAATVVALTIFGAPLAASAAPSNLINASGGINIHTDDHEDDGDDDEDDHDEHHGSIPPVFVGPGQKRHHDQHKPNAGTNSPDAGATTGSAGIDPLTGEPVSEVGPDGQPITTGPGSDNLGGVQPEDARAVDITRVPKHMKTPADEFMDAAYVGLGLLGASAVGLGVTAGVRAVRVRRSGKSDYIYNDK